ncbi:hypothetical protein Gohar_020933 [Gossypium harknessii]|uniref:Uncharacterized protein n=1 Tax=Gossypium harknessii TaxID=34285 RepID=A0A7J9HZB9_9ROSI|nr:hypothetical protein [Gossypium harknessii]
MSHAEMQYKRFSHMYVEFHRYHWRVSVSPLLFVEIWYHQTNVNSGMQVRRAWDSCELHFSSCCPYRYAR